MTRRVKPPKMIPTKARKVPKTPKTIVVRIWRSESGTYEEGFINVCGVEFEAGLLDLFVVSTRMGKGAMTSTT